MKKHTRIYLQHFSYGEQDMIPCEICGSRAVDIHHIRGRGKGKDVIENLMGLCRDHHNQAHADKISKTELQEIHNKFMQNEK
jgi:predicted restriction endonuclease